MRRGGSSDKGGCVPALCRVLLQMQAQECPKAKGTEAQALLGESKKLGAKLLRLTSQLAQIREVRGRLPCKKSHQMEQESAT